MRKFWLVALATLLYTTPAIAAPKSIQVKKLDILATSISADGLVISGNTLITYFNSGTLNSNILLTGFDITGAQVWIRTIDSGADEIATAATVDAVGNIWLGGSSAALENTESATATVIAENPDGVVVEELPQLRPDMNLITIWKLSPQGDLLATYALPQIRPALISAISVNSSGISVVGTMESRPVLVSASLTGEFKNPLFIGSSKTTINSVIRSTDETINLFGESSETLGGKKLAGAKDGVLVKINKSGAITSVVRSSAVKAERSWLGADSTLALTGYVKTGTAIQTAFTKFNSSYIPTWTLRVPSTGSSAVLSAAGVTYGALSSNSAIKGIKGWKPTSPTLLLITFTKKGIISGAYADGQLSDPISLAYSKELGLCGLARVSGESVSIFRLGTR